MTEKPEDREQTEPKQGTDREQLLRSLAEQIRTGDYEVDADALASAILEQLRKDSGVQK